MDECKICGSNKIVAKVITNNERDNRSYCNDCFISILQTENLLHDHAQRMFSAKKKH